MISNNSGTKKHQIIIGLLAGLLVVVIIAGPIAISGVCPGAKGIVIVGNRRRKKCLVLQHS